MEVVVGNSAGFCGGVLNSVTKSYQYLEKNKELYALGELVHNKEVINNLEKKGLIFIDSLDNVKNGSHVIIRAHGVNKETYEKAKEKNLTLYDLTCPKVLKIHEKTLKYLKENYFILLVALKEHPEVKGTISFCGENSFIIENINDINEAVQKLEKSNLKKVVVMAQTTFSLDLFKEITEILKEKLKDYELLIDNTICNATEIRQKETKELALMVDAMIIIGGKNSSNTKKLYEISKKICPYTYLIETVNDLDASIKKFNKVGIMAGASTPKESIDEVLSYLQSSRENFSR